MRKPNKTKDSAGILTTVGIIPLMVLGLVILSQPLALASWFVDASKFHISVHGQNSCQDCHADISGRLHPNPAEVNKDLKDFFHPDTCLDCHDDVMEDLDDGMHGAKKIKDRKKYEDCLDCHHPHYQLRLDENEMGKFDPNRPVGEQCGACHEPRKSLPPASDENKACLACHQSVEPKDPRAEEKIARLCFHCHGAAGSKAQKITTEMVPPINKEEYKRTPHVRVACTSCHQQAAQFLHTNQKLGACTRCHPPHDEKVARDAHPGVACGACHLDGIEPVRDPASKAVIWERRRQLGEPSRIHQMIRGDEEAACQRCHAEGNQVGAVSMVLPAKSILCMPCHTATFSVGDTVTIISLIIFFVGLVLGLSIWLTGSLPGEGSVNPLYKGLKLLRDALMTIFSLKIALIIRAMILDVLLQRRLYRQSKTRWLIHSLIFLPLVFRFTWGLVALVASLWKPEWPWVWAMINKNHASTAFLFDLTGIMVLFGVTLAVIRGLLRRSDHLPGLPRQDYLALGLLAGIVVIGYVMEGVRMAMTGAPGDAQSAFVGYGLSLLFSDASGLTEAYGYIWYIHAILTGAFVAYLPFSRLFHIIMAPVVLAMNAVSEPDHG
ncbi:MAG: respiratory nitrate reductase subunit gamma [Desulfobacteraceae bacterium]